MGEQGMNRRERGSAGERRAAEWLLSRGMKVLERNVRSRIGEIDLVALDGDAVVFVEVKSKGGELFGRPEEMVTAVKRRRLTRLALAYLQRRGWLGRPARFDVVAVVWETGGEGRVRHFRNAFDSEGGW